MKKVAYIRVSTKEQNLDRQIQAMRELNIDDKYIYEDKESGKDFERLGYKYMKKSLEKGDLLIIKSLDRLGRNYNEIIKEWNELTKEIGADIKVLDMELLDTTKHKDLLGNFISDLVLQVLSFVAQQERDNIKQRQKEGIKVAQDRGVRFGRPSLEVDEDKFKQVYNQVKEGSITSVKAMEILGLSKTTYYRRIKEYKS
ncbi:recombinase family protein [Clostridium cylindrosporum]|uniref:Putative transposon Tn552 DNA-invertase Bin3 n=1 Tax=Clostridium cylindrosporum DSM 605 TaxID=1121307 RepID=A0A0J8DDM5_CLOCY|nr:recombinase family protein [Clostridium cylindrosporum]KMT22334.1 putative transposon Tn552 DNA-invertase Bin3 [Clostridium cylindrosporum DSM 605]